jgi:hypothetical protein
MNVQVTVKAGDVLRMLDPWTDPKANKRLQDATRAAVKTLKPPLRAEGARVSRRMGRLSNIKVGRARYQRDRPGTVIGFKRRGGTAAQAKARTGPPFFAHWVILGTKDHPGRRGGGRIRGMKPNPMIDRVARANEARTFAVFNAELDKTEAR